MLKAIIKELQLRADEMAGVYLESIYLGGGTPSLLTLQELEDLYDTVYKLFAVQHDAEVTLEANPDDLIDGFVPALTDLPINRLSIGVQSFKDPELKLLNRAHDAQAAHDCLKLLERAGFDNFSIDLIYGIPGADLSSWIENLEIAIEYYDVPHLSCYALTVEDKTALAHQVKRGKLQVNEEAMITQFRSLVALTRQNGYDHYEISNFSKQGYLAAHNSNYWRDKNYLGVGPSAHSFNGKSRSWNISNNSKYIKMIETGTLPLTTETLTQHQKYNEYVMTGLRTKWGCDSKVIGQFGDMYSRHFLQSVRNFIEKRWIEEHNSIYTLSDDGKLFADQISGDLFLV